MNEPRVCIYCGKEFFKPKTEGLEHWNTKRKFCSNNCQTSHKIGKPSWNTGNVGFLAKDKHYKWKGGKPKCVDCGMMLANIYAKRCRKCSHLGNLHWRWAGNSKEHALERKRKPYRDWRNMIFERDNYECQICGIRGGTLNAHHICSFSTSKTLRLDTDNGITLCESCHKKFHAENGKKDNSAFQLAVFIPQNIQITYTRS